jgi:hypothetical protein
MTALVARITRLPAPRRWSVAAFSLLIVGLVWSLVTPALSGDGVPGTEPWLAALDSATGDLQPGDTVLIHPPWRDDVLDAIEARGLPAGARATIALALPHGQAPGRVLLLADPSAPLPRSRRAQLRGATVTRTAGVDVGWLGSAPTQTGDVDFGARIALAQVRVEKPDGSTVRCSWNNSRDRHVCQGLREWMYVGPDSRVISGRAEACTWTHPMTNGKVFIRWDGTPLPPTLELKHALSDQATGNKTGAPVTMTLRADGKQIARSVRTNARGFRTERVKVPEGASSLELEVTTPNDGARHYCWRLRGVAE